MRKVGMGTEKEKMEAQTIPYEAHMDAVKEIERLQGLIAGLNLENEALKAENKNLKEAAEKTDKDKK